MFRLVVISAVFLCSQSQIVNAHISKPANSISIRTEEILQNNNTETKNVADKQNSVGNNAFTTNLLSVNYPQQVPIQSNPMKGSSSPSLSSNSQSSFNLPNHRNTEQTSSPLSIYNSLNSHIKKLQSNQSPQQIPDHIKVKEGTSFILRQNNNQEIKNPQKIIHVPDHKGINGHKLTPLPFPNSNPVINSVTNPNIYFSSTNEMTDTNNNRLGPSTLDSIDSVSKFPVVYPENSPPSSLPIPFEKILSTKEIKPNIVEPPPSTIPNYIILSDVPFNIHYAQQEEPEDSSLKSLLPLFLNILKERKSGNTCRCCQCRCHKNEFDCELDIKNNYSGKKRYKPRKRVQLLNIENRSHEDDISYEENISEETEDYGDDSDES